MNRIGLCGMSLYLLSLTRTPQVVLLTHQTDARQNGVYEALLDGSLARLGDPARRTERVALGPGWRLSDTPDEHGFSVPERCVDMATTDGMSAMLRAAIIGGPEPAPPQPAVGLVELAACVTAAEAVSRRLAAVEAVVRRIAAELGVAVDQVVRP